MTESKPLTIKIPNHETAISIRGGGSLHAGSHHDLRPRGGAEIFWDGGTIPDPLFRQYVLDNFDKNGDGKISRTEAEAVTEIDVNGQDKTASPEDLFIKSLEGIGYFPNLTLLNCSFNEIRHLHLANNPKLITLYCAVNLFNSLDLSQNPQLRKLIAGAMPYVENPLSSLKLATNNILEVLDISASSFTSLSISARHLTELHCTENTHFTSLNLSGCPALKELYCDTNQLETLNVSYCPGLEYLDCYSNKLSSIDIAACTKLEVLSCGRNNLSTLNISRNPNLQRLYCSGNNIKKLNLSSCSALRKLDCKGNPIELLDVSGLNLTELGIPEKFNLNNIKYTTTTRFPDKVSIGSSYVYSYAHDFNEQIKKFEQQQAQVEQERIQQAEQARQREVTKAEAQQRAAEYKRTLMPYITAKDWESVDRIASEGLSQLPNGDAYLYLARARAYFERNLRFDTDYSENATSYHNAYREEANQLVRLCNQSICCDASTRNNAYFYRGLAYIMLRETDKAVADFKQNMNNPEFKALSYYNTGIAYMNAKRYLEAMPNFKSARLYYSDEKEKERCLRRVKECQERIDSR